MCEYICKEYMLENGRLSGGRQSVYKYSTSKENPASSQARASRATCCMAIAFAPRWLPKRRRTGTRRSRRANSKEHPRTDEALPEERRLHLYMYMCRCSLLRKMSS